MSEDYSQNGEEKIIVKELDSKNTNGFFLDIGAFDGERLSNTRRLALDGWSGILVEPHPVHAEKCRKLYADRSDVVTAEVALCDKDGTCDMFSNDTFYSTLDVGETKRWKSCKDITFGKVSVRTMKFETFFRSYVYAHQVVDFASIDAEGSDHIILRDMLTMGVLPKLVCVEHNGKIYDLCFNLLTAHGYSMIAKNAENLIMKRQNSVRPALPCKEPIIVSYARNGREEYTRSIRNMAVSLVRGAWPYEKRLYTLQDVPVKRHLHLLAHYAGEKERNYLKSLISEENLWDEHKVEAEWIHVTKSPMETLRFGQELHGVPYSFKYASVQSAREVGYELIFWSDSSLRYVGNAPELSERLSSAVGGILCWTARKWPLEMYISWQCAKALGVTLEQVRKIPQVIGGFVGWNFRNPVACKVFEEMLVCMSSLKDECFSTSPTGLCEEYVEHRHDQAVLSVLMWKNGITPLSDDAISYDTDTARFFHVKGIVL